MNTVGATRKGRVLLKNFYTPSMGTLAFLDFLKGKKGGREAKSPPHFIARGTRS